MSKELVINTDGQNTRIAIVEDGDLAELFIETEEHERTIGNLFVGKIRRVMPSIQAAFVDVGQKQDAFLHFSDLTESIADWLEYIRQDNPEIARFAPGHVQKARSGRRRRPVSAPRRKRLEDGAEDPEAELAAEQSENGDQESHRRLAGKRGRGRRKAGQSQRPQRGRSSRGRPSERRSDSGEEGVPPENFLKRDQPILVKISKEPIAAKGSRVTTDISLAGRFLVLVPMANYVAVSKKVSSFKERRRLRALAKMLLPDGFGVIVRTVAEGQNAKALDTDLRLLKEKWQDIERRLAERPKPPAPVYQDVNMVSSIMRDLFSEDFDRILIDDQRMYRNIKGYVQAIAPEMGAKVILHDKKAPVFRSVGIERSVSEAFESRVNLPSGGYLFIEQTEAMHVVDVNSGRAGRGLSQEDNSLKVNLEAAKVIARQIRLRDLGGILVIDFIDMRSERSRRKVYEQIRREFRNDRAVTKVLPMSDFGLMQITRQRLRPSITHTFSDMHEDDAFDTGATAPGEGVPARDRVRERPRDVDPETVITRITDWMEAFGAAKWKGAVRLKVHPFTAAYLAQGLLPFGLKAFFKYRTRIILEESAGMDPTRFRFFDETNGKEIRRPPRRGRKKKAERKPSKSSASQDPKDSAAPTAAATSSARDGKSKSTSDSKTDSGEAKGGSRRDSRRDSGRSRGRRPEEDSSESRGRARSGRGRRSEEDASDASESRGRGRGRRSEEDASESRGRGRGDRGRRSEEDSSDASESRGRGRSDRGRRSEEDSSDASESRGRGRSGRGRRSEEDSSDSSESRGRGSTSRGRKSSEDTADSPEPRRRPSRRKSEAAESPEPAAVAAETAETPEAKKPTRKAPSRSRTSQADTGDEMPKASADEPDTNIEDSNDAPSTRENGAGRDEERTSRGAGETVRAKTPTPQPFRLRYSSSHTTEPEEAASEKT